jgi:hypothetical protein
MSVKGGKMSPAMVVDVVGLLVPLLEDSSMDTQKEAAKCLG